MSIEDVGTVAAEAPSGVTTETGERGHGYDNVHPEASTKYGAHSPEIVAPIRDRNLVVLRERFPSADVTILGLQATRLAQLELVGIWLDSKGGPMRNRRTGTIFPAAEYWAKIASAYERQHERLEAQAASSGDGNGRTPTLAEIAAELATGDGGEPDA
jgi:hypothetical protein